MNKIRQWAEDHGEIPMTMSQFQIEEEHAKEERTDRGAEKFTLELTADELDWLLFQVMKAAERIYDKKPETGLSAELRFTRDQWWKQVSKQGYKPF